MVQLPQVFHPINFLFPLAGLLPRPIDVTQCCCEEQLANDVNKLQADEEADYCLWYMFLYLYGTGRDVGRPMIGARLTSGTYGMWDVSTDFDISVSVEVLPAWCRQIPHTESGTAASELY
nr:hypothetical protein BaRGS_018814 [Batillaria attramentaria]